MQYYSTNNRSKLVSLKEAVVQGLAPDQGLFMPQRIVKLTDEFFNTIHKKSLTGIALEVTKAFVENDIPEKDLEQLVQQAINFEAPLVKIEEDVFALELFHGPTLAFKDFGARFLAGLLGHFSAQLGKQVTILVATSGDTGSAVANGFLNFPGIQVIVLYPSGKVSEMQEKQFTTLGGNITALEVQGTFDDCQRLVKEAFLNDELRAKYFLTSANSINIARLIPQTFYYFYAFAQVAQGGKPVVFSVPSGNFGNLTAGLMAKRMGLPVQQFIAATNINDTVPEFLKTGVFTPKPSRQTISNAMDVGNPSNFFRLLDLYDGDVERMKRDVTGYRFTDEETKAAIQNVYRERNYLLDPHGAVGYLGLKVYAKSHTDFTGILLETAHPGKFNSVVEEVIQQQIKLPVALRKFLGGEKKSIPMSSHFKDFKDYLMKAF